jgi:hypothetical protein
MGIINYPKRKTNKTKQKKKKKRDKVRYPSASQKKNDQKHTCMDRHDIVFSLIEVFVESARAFKDGWSNEYLKLQWKKKKKKKKKEEL